MNLKYFNKEQKLQKKCQRNKIINKINYSNKIMNYN